ncbi:MAG: tRNA lysidine(34) synthetase TilS [Deltaproteobacteria bacterium]|nr:tRNA lysidine(34) synthetase TilS [Deltaproteobacteria bacterium]
MKPNLEKRVMLALREISSQGPRLDGTGLVLVSGGSDSTALLRLLHALTPRFGWGLEVVHFHHGLRPEAEAEAAWVAALAERLGLPCHVRRGTHLAGQPGLQARARAWRQQETRALLAERGAAWAATGHQAGDQRETLLMKWLRGAHLAHLRGMEPWQPPHLRPLLGVERETLREYLTGLGQGWLEDPTNHSPRYKRNRVRNELIPLLEELCGNLPQRLETLAAQSTQLEAWLNRLPEPAQGVEGAPWVSAGELAALPALARGYLLHRFVERQGVGLEFRHLEPAVELLETNQGGWRLDLPGGRCLKRERDKLWLEG